MDNMITWFRFHSNYSFKWRLLNHTSASGFRVKISPLSVGFNLWHLQNACDPQTTWPTNVAIAHSGDVCYLVCGCVSITDIFRASASPGTQRSPPFMSPHPNHQSSSCPSTSLADPCLICLYQPPDRQPRRWRRKERRRAQRVTVLAVQPFDQRECVCALCVGVWVSPHPLFVCMCVRPFFISVDNIS